MYIIDVCIYIYIHITCIRLKHLRLGIFGTQPEEMMKSVVPGWARPCEMIGKDAMEYKLHGVEGEPCLFKHVSPRDITQGGVSKQSSFGFWFLRRYC